MKLPLNCIHQGDCLDGLKKLPADFVDLAFADPPFNIGYSYDVYDDRKHYQAYLDWTKSWMKAVCRVLKSTGTFWVAIGDEYAAEIKLIAQRDLNLTCRSWVIWYYTFGVNCSKKFNRSHAHLFHFVKDPDRFTFNEDEISVPSARQLVYADGRADPGGRLPDDTWILRPQDVQGGFSPQQATWYFPRVAGTFKERSGFHGCQMPEQLLGRIIRVCSNPGEIVLDPFAGSGTTLAVARKLGRRWLGFELSEEYTRRALTRINKTSPGEPLEGPPEPVVSAPRTPKLSSKIWLRSAVQRAILEAFLAANDGWSSDRVIADPELNQKFCDECRDLGLPGKLADWNLALMRLRKEGKWQSFAKTKRTAFAGEDMDAYLFASEIAMRLRMDLTGLSLDDILCDPEQGPELDAVARRFAPGFSSFQYRWGAFTIRKRAKSFREKSRNLPPHLERQKFLDFLAVHDLRTEGLKETPGVYLARKPAMQNLYVGETFDLGRRFDQHKSADGWQSGQEIQVAVIPLQGIDPEDRWGLKSRLIGKYQPELNYLELGG